MTKKQQIAEVIRRMTSAEISGLYVGSRTISGRSVLLFDCGGYDGGRWTEVVDVETDTGYIGETTIDAYRALLAGVES